MCGKFNSRHVNDCAGDEVDIVRAMARKRADDRRRFELALKDIKKELKDGEKNGEHQKN
jgi:hypothetical protein